ncbi:hypothetical protein D3C71_1866320 [compost metagenome]
MKAASRFQIARLDNPQNGGVQARAGFWTIGQRRRCDRAFRFTEATLHRPQIGGVHALGTCQRLRVAVLRKQRDR